LLPPLVEIPAGEVGLGSSWLETWRLARRGFPAGDERPRHRLRQRAFAIGRYPVTHAEYACFVDDGGYGEARWWGRREIRGTREAGAPPRRHPGPPNTGRIPGFC
jgi:formylglycine-generating enzyme required for sulfatase activity